MTSGPKMIEMAFGFPALLPSHQNVIQNGPQLLPPSHFQEFKGLADYMGGISLRKGLKNALFACCAHIHTL